MKVEQYEYLSPEAIVLRQRDGTPPWGVHVCEVDACANSARPGTSGFYTSWLEASRLRAEIEADV